MGKEEFTFEPQSKGEKLAKMITDYADEVCFAEGYVMGRCALILEFDYAPPGEQDVVCTGSLKGDDEPSELLLMLLRSSKEYAKALGIPLLFGEADLKIPEDGDLL